MEIIEPSVQIMDAVDEKDILAKLELCGRTAYKSEDKITGDSAKRFVGMILKSGHGSVLEHANITVKLVCDRGVANELVRHRIASYTQESTRYCNYARKGMTVVNPPFWAKDSDQYREWLVAMRRSEETYNHLIGLGATPQEARSVLPNSLKTEIVATMNIREWRHVLTLRTKPDCHPQMRQLMGLLLSRFKEKLPALFADIGS